jgi:hypothetical protein
VPEFFGTCPDDANTQIDGVLGVFSQADWEAMRADEMAARVPRVVTRRQAKAALLLAGLLDSVQPAIDAIPDVTQRALMQLEWNEAMEFERTRPSLIQLAAALGLGDAELDQLFIAAAKL